MMRTRCLFGVAIAVFLVCQAVANGARAAEAPAAGLSPVAASEQSNAKEKESGFIETVDTPAAAEAKSWSHTVEESGDYQIGSAWVEVISGGSVEVTIRAGGQNLRTVKAGPGRAPERLETRVEGLDAGDVIEVKAVPENGTRYRLGYRLVFGTPTFPLADVFSVSDFGAIGDGRTDDFAAIGRAVEAAKEAGAGIIRFESDRTYRLIGENDMTREVVFPLSGAANIKVEGNGAKLMLHPPDGLADIEDARNIQIDGLEIGYSPLPYFQGEITAIDIERMTIDLVVPERYRVPEVGSNTFHGPFFGRSFIPDAPGARSGRGDNIYVESITRIGSDRQLRIQVPRSALGSDTPNAPMRARLTEAKRAGATEFVAPDLRYGHRGGQTVINGSSRIKFSNLRWSSVPHFWLSIRDNMGPITLSNVDLQMSRPETELYVSWRDGLHIKNSRFGILIEEADLDGAAMYDDTFAIYTRTHRIVEIDGDRLGVRPAFRDHKDMNTWRAGDWVSVWSEDQIELRGMSRLIAATDRPGVNFFDLQLEAIPTGAQTNDTVINEEILNRNTVIRNSRTTNVGTEDASTRFRATEISFDNNHFDDFEFTIEFDGFWGTPRSRNVTVKDTYIGSEGGRILLHSPIGVRFKNSTFDNTQLISHRDAKNVVLDTVRWTNMAGAFLRLGPESEAWIFGDSSVNGRSLRQNNDGLKKQVRVDPTSTLHLTEPPTAE